MILSDFDLNNYIRDKRLVIKPFEAKIVRENGLDLRLGPQIARMNKTDKILDTRSDDAIKWYDLEENQDFVIKPQERLLCHTIEKIELPLDLMGICHLRSTYARYGLLIPPTIIDAGFKGQLTIEIVGGSFPVKVYSGDRFLHVVFSKLTSPVSKPYEGKYVGQTRVTMPKKD